MKPYNISIDDYHKTVKLFHEESDRAAAILAGSYMENYLAKFLKNHMVNDKKSSAWFDRDGPFSTFNQRIIVAYAFKLIPKNTKHDLIYISKIRNHFAHHPFEASFDKPPVIDWINNFIIYNKLDIEKSNDSSREKYLLTISMCVYLLNNNMTKRPDSDT
ncbi:MAG: hypothetical protein JW786_13090 [Desulfobacterales bacterium]|nr:hypothetical protein [Desulfobacterales bacterium]